MRPLIIFIKLNGDSRVSKMFFSALLCFIGFLTTTSLADDLLSSFPKCYLNDPKLNDCLLNATETMRPYLKKGIPEIQFPSLYIYKTEFEMTQETPVLNYTGWFWNFTMRRLHEYNFKELHFDSENLSIRGKIQFPHLHITSNARLQGTFKSFVLDGTGLAFPAFDPTLLTFNINGTTVQFEGKEHYDVTGIKVNIRTNYFDLYIADITGKETNEMIHQNSKLLKDLMTPAFENVVEEKWTEYLKYLTGKFSLNELLPSQATAK